MNILQKITFFTALCGLLVGCGNDGQKDLYGDFWGTTKAALPSKKRAEAESKTAAFEAAVLAKLNQPLIIASNDKFSLPLIRVSENGAYEQWHTPGKVGVTFQDGFVTATRGLGGDLMNADVEESIERLHSGSRAPATRVNRYLDGENKIVMRSFVCIFEAKRSEDVHVAAAVRTLNKAVETCTSSDFTFENTYWISPHDGFIWKSKQWVSAFIGEVVFERKFR